MAISEGLVVKLKKLSLAMDKAPVAGVWLGCDDVGKAGMRRLVQQQASSGPIGNIPPAEAEERYCAMLDAPAMAA